MVRPNKRMIVRCLQQADRPLRPKDIAQKVGLPRGKVTVILRKIENRYVTSEMERGVKGRRHNVRVWSAIEGIEV